MILVGSHIIELCMPSSAHLALSLLLTHICDGLTCSGKVKADIKCLRQHRNVRTNLVTGEGPEGLLLLTVLTLGDASTGDLGEAMGLTPGLLTGGDTGPGLVYGDR